MTQEDKNLLLIDICARLSYHPIVYIDENLPRLKLGASTRVWEYIAIDKPCKPYLRSMSSMTEEEREEFRIVGGVMSHNLQNDSWAISAFTPEAYDWLNAHHFDYRGLIEGGLAIEASVDMYKID